MILRKLELGSFGSNCYIIGDEVSKEGMVIDPGDDGSFIMKQVKALGLKIKVIVLTHSHVDHIGGLAEVKKATGAEIAIHESEAPFLLKQPFHLDFMPPTPPSPPAEKTNSMGCSFVADGRASRVAWSNSACFWLRSAFARTTFASAWFSDACDVSRAAL